MTAEQPRFTPDEYAEMALRNLVEQNAGDEQYIFSLLRSYQRSRTLPDDLQQLLLELEARLPR